MPNEHIISSSSIVCFRVKEANSAVAFIEFEPFLIVGLIIRLRILKD
jgi:hypothetical protein